MKTTHRLQLTRKLAVLIGILSFTSFASIPASAQMESDEPMRESTETSDEMTPDATEGEMAPDATEEDMAPEATEGEANLVELLATSDSFSTLAQAVEAAGLEDTLSTGGSYTVFAPTDQAFADLPAGALDLLLMPENQDLLTQLLTYHVAEGELTASEIETGLVKTLGGGLAVRVTEDNRVIVNDGSVVQADIQASNGIVHAVNRVLMPREVRESITNQLNQQ